MGFGGEYLVAFQCKFCYLLLVHSCDVIWQCFVSEELPLFLGGWEVPESNWFTLLHYIYCCHDL
jgi:hypothetical protein